MERYRKLWGSTRVNQWPAVMCSMPVWLAASAFITVVWAGCSPGGSRTDIPNEDSAAAMARGAGTVQGSTVDVEIERVPIRVGGVDILVEIADEPSERQEGLMYRESLDDGHGMLFIYPSERTLGFWMKNTIIPLDIAYADKEGRIVDIQQMEPRVTNTYDSAAPAMYALEMNQGWFEAHSIRVGDRIEFEAASTLNCGWMNSAWPSRVRLPDEHARGG